MIFPNLVLEPIVQVGDSTRLDARRSFVANNAADIVKIEITPGTGAAPIDITDFKFLDWQFFDEGEQVIQLEIETDPALDGPITKNYSLMVVSAEDDALFSSDEELVRHEHDILEFLPQGKSSFKNIHRQSQTNIMDYLDEQRIYDIEGKRLLPEAIVNKEEVRRWSAYQTLVLIFESLSNSVDDIYARKADHYRKKRNEARNRGRLSLDTSGDGEKDTSKDMRTYILLRR